MNDTDEPDADGGDDTVLYLADLADPETPLDHTRAEYAGIELEEESQPLDEVELAEEGLLLDDPERLAAELDGVTLPSPSLDPDDVGWDLDAPR